MIKLLSTVLFLCHCLLTSAYFTDSDCVKDVQYSPICKAFITVYKWEHTKQKCVAAIYGGCNPTNNNFRTEAECEKNAKPVCKKLPRSLIFTVKDCEKDVQEGPVNCMAYIPVYKWDQTDQKCVKALYGGCHATNNNFRTEEDCLLKATPICKNVFVEQKPQEHVFNLGDCAKDVQEGPVTCMAYMPVYKWDQKEQTCIKAVYGGCHSTNNNFKTEQECLKYAIPVCKMRQVGLHFQIEDCQKDVEDGSLKCKAYIPVYKWDHQKQKCVKAIYGGCRGTSNNFKIEEDCQKYAAPICKVQKYTLAKETQKTPVFNKEDCEKDVQEGPVACKAYVPVYKWDHKAQTCVAAIYGGCHATHNNFKTQEECLKYATPVCNKTQNRPRFEIKDCQESVEKGPYHCRAYIPVYKWDHSNRKCVKAIYGGCHPTNNNFKTEKDCLKYAQPVCRKDLSSSTFVGEDCKKDVEEGPIHCMAYIPVYKWDVTKQMCVKAIYGGCNPTNNNFRSNDECERFAKPICEKQ